MGIFCMIFGGVVFVASLLGGYCLASALLIDGLLLGGADVTLAQLFAAPNAENVNVYIICICVMGFIGLIIGLSLYMNGLIYNKVDKIRLRRRRPPRDDEE